MGPIDVTPNEELIQGPRGRDLVKLPVLSIPIGGSRVSGDCALQVTGPGYGRSAIGSVIRPSSTDLRRVTALR